MEVYTGGAAGDTLFLSAYLGVYVTVFQPFLSNEVLFASPAGPRGPGPSRSSCSPRAGHRPELRGACAPGIREEGGRVQYISYVKNTGFLRQEQEIVKVTFGQ